MAKSKPTPPADSRPAESKSFWLPFTMAGIFGLLAGGTGTYLALSPRLHPPAAALAGATAAPTDPASHLPSPDLTAGQTPAQADRTLGNFYYDHQNWPLAIKHYESAISQGSNDADIRTDLGNAYRFAGRPGDALAQYQLAQKMNPAHEFSLFNQGGLYLEEMMQPAKAIEIWNEYLVRFPTGRNVAAARQLIAQTQGGGAGLALPAGPGGAVSPAEDLILQRIKSAQTTGSKP
jgi:tetratricopeptide (TPR) repeat protein